MRYIPPAHNGLDICYRDDSLLILNKPCGLLSVPGRGEDKRDSLSTRVQAEYPDAMIVHRLDMATSGLMLLALGTPMQKALSRLFQQREIDKAYQAIVTGQLDNPSGEIDLPLITDWPNRPRQKVDYATGKPSLTRYQLLDYAAGQQRSRVSLVPVTGRSHQLRVHMSALGHAILGDQLYATKTVRKQASRLLLHACELGFKHPLTGNRIHVHSAAPF